MRPIVTALALALLPAAAVAQAGETVVGRTVPDSLFRAAQRLVVGGNGADGRAIVDSLLQAARPGSPDYAEALYWHAALAETAAEAERGYLRLSIEYPLSPRTDDALIRLGQLELTRGNRELALRRFERAATEFPDSPQRARTELMIARIYLDARQWGPGCAAVRDGQQAADAQDVELRNQLGYLGNQCAAAGAMAAAGPLEGHTAAPAGPATDSAPRAASTAGDATTVTAAPRPVRDSGRAAPGARPSPPRVVRPVRQPRPADTARGVPAASPSPRVVTPGDVAPPRRPTTAPAATPRVVEPAAHAADAPAAAPRATPRAPGFSVQVAAFDRAEPARALAEKLRKDGWDARVDTDAQWQRVRVGYVATRAEATELAKRLMEKGVNGFVTGVGGR